MPPSSVLLYSTKMWPLGKILESCVNVPCHQHYLFMCPMRSAVGGLASQTSSASWFSAMYTGSVMTTRWLPYQSHLLVQRDIYKLATTLWQITKSLEGHHPPGHPSRLIWHWSVFGSWKDKVAQCLHGIRFSSSSSHLLEISDYKDVDSVFTWSPPFWFWLDTLQYRLS